MPAFVVPFFFVLDPLGAGVLLQLPKGGTWAQVAVVDRASASSPSPRSPRACRAGSSRRPTLVERALLIVAGLLVIVPAAKLDYVGIGPLRRSPSSLQFLRRRRAPAPA